MPTISLTADAGQVTSATNQLTAQLQKVDSRIKEVTSTINKFNADGILISSTVRGLTKDNQVFTAQLGLLANALKLAKAGMDPGPLNVLGVAYRKTAESVNELTNKQTVLNNFLNRTARALQYFVVYRVFNQLSSDLREGVTAAKEFQVQISLIRTISQESQLSFARFGSDVRKVSDQSGAKLNDVAKAFYNTASNQIAKGGDIAPFVSQAAELARVTGSELPDSVNLLSSAINAYGMSAKDAEKLSAIFFKTIDEGRVVASELANTFGRVAVLGANLGVSIEDVNATIAITTQKGFKTADALTLLTNLFIKLEKPTEATRAFFRSLGVDSGEAAIKLYGFNGVLRKMIESIKSGQVDVSAFFDEIRGRKQFAVFEQSIDQIENFSDRLKDTTQTIADYNKAVNIRGESPADYLRKEGNKLTNIMAADFGQGFVKIASDSLKFVGGIQKMSKSLGDAAPILETVGKALVAYGILQIAITAKNYLMATSFVTTATAATTLASRLAPLLAFLAAYELMSRQLKRGGLEIDVSKAQDTIVALDEIRSRFKSLTGTDTAYKGFDVAFKRVEENYRSLLGIIAQAQIQNDRFLDSAKIKSKEVAESVKVGFASFADTIKDGISELKKGITEANNEIDKSRKSLLGFKDTLDSLLFKSQMRFATDQQKIALSDNRINELISKATTLLGSSDKNDRDEGRKLFDQAASMIADVEEQKQELQKKYYEQNLKQTGAQGNFTFYANTDNERKRLNDLYALRVRLEEGAQKVEGKGIEQKEKSLKLEEAKLRKFEAALKQYENVDIFDAAGKIKSGYKDKSGRFDKGKFDADLKRSEADIKAAAGTDLESRIKIEILFAQRRQSLIEEAGAAERQEFLRTQQARLQAAEEEHRTKIKNIQEQRDKSIKSQDAELNKLAGQEQELKAFYNVLNTSYRKSAGPLGPPKETLDKFKEAEQAIRNYAFAVDQAKTNAKKGPDGSLILQDKDLDKIESSYNIAIMKLKELRALKKGEQPALQAPELNNITIGESEAINQEALKKLKNSRVDQINSYAQEDVLNKEFEGNVVKPIEALKAKFPELSAAATEATNTMKKGFEDLAGPGLQPLIDRLNEIEKKMKELNVKPENKVGIIGEFGGAAYAASGGVVGAFPGQPRGVDRYPVWAAAGERIIDAKSYRQFKPQIESILNRRNPTYMASGGVIGGDTTVGDVNITLANGTPDDNVREFAYKLKREMRRGTIKFN